MQQPEPSFLLRNALPVLSYLVDYGRKEGTPMAWMQQQCATGLRWLKERRIEGIIFLGNTTMDLGFASVEWTREWVQKVGNTRL